MRRVIWRVVGVFLAGIFVNGGSDAFREPGRRADAVARAGFPSPELMVRLNGAGMVVGGAILGLGIAPRLGAALLIFCLVPTTLVGHQFWSAEPNARANQKTQFLKNLGLIGGLLAILAHEDPA